VTAGASEVKKASELISESLEAVATPLSSAGERATIAFDAIESSVDGFNKSLIDQNNQVTNASSLMSQVATKAALLAGELEKSRNSLDKVFADIGKVPEALTDTATGVDSAAKQLAHSVQTVLSPLHKEVHEIDRLVGDLTTILTRRVSELESVR
jgi:uncharacterized protein YoxC